MTANGDPSTYVALGTVLILEGMVERGFTTVQDVGGAGYGIHDAQREGIVRGSSSAAEQSLRPAAK